MIEYCSFSYELIFGVGYLFVCFSNHPGIDILCFCHSAVHVFVLLGALCSITEV